MRYVFLWIAFGSDVQALSDNDFAVREAAEARLTRWGDLAWPVLDRHFADLERRRRARRILAQIVPQNTPPIALLSGNPLPEWILPDNTCRIGHSTEPCWRLTWLRPDKHAPLIHIIRFYGERARTQWTWKDWQIDRDGREATRLLARDLTAVGVPPIFVRQLVDHMETKNVHRQP